MNQLVMMLSTASVRTPFEGSVKGVQCGVEVDDEVRLGLAMLMSCRASIFIFVAALPLVLSSR